VSCTTPALVTDEPLSQLPTNPTVTVIPRSVRAMMIRYMDKIKALHERACDDYMIANWDSIPRSGKIAFDKLWNVGGMGFRMSFDIG
jgi:hypothetical protein